MRSTATAVTGSPSTTRGRTRRCRTPSRAPCTTAGGGYGVDEGRMETFRERRRSGGATRGRRWECAQRPRRGRSSPSRGALYRSACPPHLMDLAAKPTPRWRPAHAEQWLRRRASTSPSTWRRGSPASPARRATHGPSQQERAPRADARHRGLRRLPRRQAGGPQATPSCAPGRAQCVSVTPTIRESTSLTAPAADPPA